MMKTFILLAVATAAFAVDQCHLRELDLCAATGAGQNKVPTNDAEIDTYCGMADEGKQCMGNYTAKCTTPIQKELITFATEGAKDLGEKFCKHGDALRVDYLKHAPCIAKAQPDAKKCVTDVQAGLEKIEVAKFQDRISTACCTYVRYQKCSTGVIEGQCGKEAVEYGNLIIKLASSNLIDVMCQGYGTNPVCDSLLPPPGTKPNGNSKSVVYKLFSAYVQT